jgi:hypothetical protein
MLREGVPIGVLVLTGTARAQQVYWEAPGSLGAGQRASLDLVFADTEPAGAVDVPSVDDLTLLGPPAQQSSISIINGARRVGQTLSFPIRAEREGRFPIPSFDERDEWFD